jgi:protein required for attachment to host cells
MAAKQETTWIVVLDGGQAQFYALRKDEDGQVFERAAEPLSAETRVATKPGRSFATGKARGVVEPRQNVRKLEKHDFIRAIAGLLDVAAGRRKFARLVLAAPPRSLGELRDILSDRVLAALTHEIPKTLTKFPPDLLWKKLSAQLLTAAKPLAGRRSKDKSAPAVPVSVQFRNTASSPAVEADAMRYAAQLSRKFARIESCKVTIESPRRLSPKGRAFEINLDVVLAGRRIASRSAGDGRHSHENAHNALRIAFTAIERQLRDHAEKRGSTSRMPVKKARRRIAEEVD